MPSPASSRSLAPRHWPPIRRHCGRSRSTTPAPILRPIRASSTWSSTMERSQATWRKRASRSPKSTTPPPSSISTPTIRQSSERASAPRSPKAGRRFRSPTSIRSITDPDSTPRFGHHVTLTNPQAGDLLAATLPLPGRHHRFRLQPGHRRAHAHRSTSPRSAAYSTVPGSIRFSVVGETAAGSRIVEVVVNDGRTTPAVTALLTVVAVERRAGARRCGRHLPGECRPGIAFAISQPHRRGRHRAQLRRRADHRRVVSRRHPDRRRRHQRHRERHHVPLEPNAACVGPHRCEFGRELPGAAADRRIPIDERQSHSATDPDLVRIGWHGRHDRNDDTRYRCRERRPDQHRAGRAEPRRGHHPADRQRLGGGHRQQRAHDHAVGHQRHPQRDRRPRRRRHRQRHRLRNHRRHGGGDQHGAGGPRLCRQPRLQRRRHDHGRDHRRDRHRHRHNRDHRQRDRPAPWIFIASGDFNGDGTHDVLWQDPITGEHHRVADVAQWRRRQHPADTAGRGLGSRSPPGISTATASRI